jgi:hypothetical protein
VLFRHWQAELAEYQKPILDATFYLFRWGCSYKRRSIAWRTTRQAISVVDPFRGSFLPVACLFEVSFFGLLCFTLDLGAL